MSSFNVALSMYRRRFRQTPTVIGLSEEAETKAADVLLAAIVDGKPLDDEAFFAKIGMDPPDDAMVI